MFVEGKFKYILHEILYSLMYAYGLHYKYKCLYSDKFVSIFLFFSTMLPEWMFVFISKILH